MKSLGLSLMLSLLTASALAEKPPKTEWGDGRVLGQHVFSFPQFVASSFVVNTFGVRAGLELRRVPNFAAAPLSGDIASRRLDLSTVIASEGIDALLRVHRVLALSLSAYGQARVGANRDTLLGTGADFQLAGDLGALVRLLRTDSFQLSLRTSAGLYGGRQAGFGRFYQDVRAIASDTVSRALLGDTTLSAERSRFEDALASAAREMVTTLSGYRVGATLTAAQALAPYLGVQAMFGFLFDRGTFASNDLVLSDNTSIQLSGKDRLMQTMLGLALDFGGALDRGFPIDFVLEYVLLPSRVKHQVSIADITQRTASQRLALDILYAGRADLQLGLSIYGLLVQARELGIDAQKSGRPRELGAAFTFRYIW